MALMNEWMNEKENSETKKNIQWLIEIQIVMIIMMMANDDKRIWPHKKNVSSFRSARTNLLVAASFMNRNYFEI